MDYPADATFYIRLSLMNPRPGEHERVSQIQDELIEYFSTQPGFVRGYKLVAGDPQGRCGRLTVWKSEEEMDRAAQTQHVLAVRAELLQLVEEGSHAEHSYTAFDPQLAKASAS